MPKDSSPASGGGERPGLRDTGVSAAKGGRWPGPRLDRCSLSRRPEATALGLPLELQQEEPRGQPGNKCLMQSSPTTGRRGCLTGSSDPREQCLPLLWKFPKAEALPGGLQATEAEGV